MTVDSKRLLMDLRTGRIFIFVLCVCVCYTLLFCDDCSPCQCAPHLYGRVCFQLERTTCVEGLGVECPRTRAVGEPARHLAGGKAKEEREVCCCRCLGLAELACLYLLR